MRGQQGSDRPQSGDQEPLSVKHISHATQYRCEATGCVELESGAHSPTEKAQAHATGSRLGGLGVGSSLAQPSAGAALIRLELDWVAFELAAVVDSFSDFWTKC
jgi:hypothetical protein